MIRRKCGALLRKGICRLWTNGFVRERPVPFLKPRPTDAFRIILFWALFLPPASDSRLRALLFLPPEKDTQPESCGMTLHVFYRELKKLMVRLHKNYFISPNTSACCCVAAICRCKNRRRNLQKIYCIVTLL